MHFSRISPSITQQPWLYIVETLDHNNLVLLYTFMRLVSGAGQTLFPLPLVQFLELPSWRFKLPRVSNYRKQKDDNEKWGDSNEFSVRTGTHARPCRCVFQAFEILMLGNSLLCTLLDLNLLAVAGESNRRRIICLLAAVHSWLFPTNVRISAKNYRNVEWHFYTVFYLFCWRYPWLETNSEIDQCEVVDFWRIHFLQFCDLFKDYRVFRGLGWFTWSIAQHFSFQVFSIEGRFRGSKNTGVSVLSHPWRCKRGSDRQWWSIGDIVREIAVHFNSLFSTDSIHYSKHATKKLMFPIRNSIFFTSSWYGKEILHSQHVDVVSLVWTNSNIAWNGP